MDGNGRSGPPFHRVDEMDGGRGIDRQPDRAYQRAIHNLEDFDDSDRVADLPESPTDSTALKLSESPNKEMTLAQLLERESQWSNTNAPGELINPEFEGIIDKAWDDPMVSVRDMKAKEAV